MRYGNFLKLYIIKRLLKKSLLAVILVALGPCVAAAAVLPLSLSKLPLQVDELQLQLLDNTTARLMARLNPGEQRRVLELNKQATFIMNFEDASLVFNDLGQAPDLKAGDGLFTAKLPLSLTKLDALNSELAGVQKRTVSKFIPRERVVVGKETLATPALDLEGLRAGRAITLPKATIFGPVKSLGGILTAINPSQSLMIMSIPIIEDPPRTFNPCNNVVGNNPVKIWTFGHLMTQMANGSAMTPSMFVEDWLNNWRVNRNVMNSTGMITLDSLSNAALANMDNKIINPWRARSGGGTLDLRLAPFRLNAIIYRPDLATSNPYGASGSNNGGELRFVFGMMNIRDNNNDGDALDVGDICQPIESAVIFEYGVPISSCSAIKNWANEWVSLSTLLPGSPAYNTKLQTLTQAVVMAGSAPGKPNQNALNQLRTNEIDLTGIWQFREFVIKPGSGPLVQTTTKNQPREHQAVFTSTGATPLPINLNGTALFLNEVLANEPAIIAGTYSVPELSTGFPFLGGGSGYNINTFWDHPSLATVNDLDARFKFSEKTCSGCHTRETNTVFYHVRPMGPGAVPLLSAFLSGPITVADPTNFRTGGALSHNFDEMGNRVQALSNLANQSCKLIGGLPPFEVLRLPLNSAH